jgi:hypothetical protein
MGCTTITGPYRLITFMNNFGRQCYFVNFPNRNEWVSCGELETAMIRLSWDRPETVSRVWLFDRPNPKDHITSGVLLFSDGSAVKVGELPNDAKSAREVSFPAKQVRWIVFAVDSVSPETSNAGLAEMAVFKD